MDEKIIWSLRKKIEAKGLEEQTDLYNAQRPIVNKCSCKWAKTDKERWTSVTVAGHGTCRGRQSQAVEQHGMRSKERESKWGSFARKRAMANELEAGEKSSGEGGWPKVTDRGVLCDGRQELLAWLAIARYCAVRQQRRVWQGITERLTVAKMPLPLSPLATHPRSGAY